MASKTLEENLFLDLIRDAPVFILNGRVYYGRKNEDSIIIKEGPRLEVLERIFYSSSEDFKKYADRLFNEQNKKDVLESFVINQILPYLNKDSLDLKSIFGGGKTEEKESEPIEKITEKEIKETRELMQKKLNLPDFDFDNFAIYDKNVYSINEAKKGSVSLGGKNYTLEKIFSLDEFKKIYPRKLIASQLESLIPEYTLKRKINAGKDVKHNSKNYGYIRKNNSISVWIKVEDYVLKDPYCEQHYSFKGHRIAIDVSWRDHAFLNRVPYSIENASGPFYYDHDLCMGSYSFGFLEREPSGRNFAKVLLDARNVVYRGYTKNCVPQFSLEDFDSHSISRQRIVSGKLNVTNINRNPATRRT